MDFKEIFAKIRAALGEEAAPKIEGLLKQVEAEVNSIADDLKAANAESKERKLKIRDLTGQIEDAGAKLKDAEGKLNNPDQVKELTDLKKFKADVLKKRKDGFADEFGKIVKLPQFEKAKDLFKLPKPNDAGEFDFSKMSDEDIDHNLAKVAELQKIGFFGDDQQPPAGGPFNLPRQTQQPPDAPKEATREGLQQHVASMMGRYK